MSLYIVGSTDMIHRPFAERADPEFYLFGNGSIGGVSKRVNAIASRPQYSVQSNLLATIIILYPFPLDCKESCL